MLGIVFDYRMNWNEHIEDILNKTNYTVFIFHKFPNLCKQTLRTLYDAYFHRIISYGIIAWEGAHASTVKLLQTPQNKILKIVNKNQFIIH